MKDIIVAQIDGYVPDTFYSRIVLPAFVGEINTISPLQLRAFDVTPLRDLRSGMYL